jgi:hypothetical protein
LEPNVIFSIPGDIPNSVINVDPRDGFQDRIDTTDINEANATHNFIRQIATICKNEAPGTVPLFRGFNDNQGDIEQGLHISTMDSGELASKGYTNEKILGYVYATLPAQGNTGFFQVYRVKIRGTELMTSDIETEKSEIPGTVAEPLFFSMPLEPKLPTTNNLDCNPYNANFTGCAFTSINCPSGRCLISSQEALKLAAFSIEGIYNFPDPNPKVFIILKIMLKLALPNKPGVI